MTRAEVWKSGLVIPGSRVVWMAAWEEKPDSPDVRFCRVAKGFPTWREALDYANKKVRGN
ncbi:hypothetical protein [Corynebacterium lactis]|uniref:Uncharacterized protein n=1 Tax=Corynebacterium lactis RW2-5 TaxID=1408189 RepID=A0A0K2H318_9CORY|nr:hypothetical protein [Corynebacterium lactis]ALA68445.1 hypothetical protein CLAC_03380 [Corynebacterium lactis RW2-5]